MEMGKTILTVDDSSTVRLVLSSTLKNAGYNVVEAVDGQDAIEQLDSGKVNMLITDLNMPRVDGIDLIRHVRRSSEYRFMPIIMLTTESDGEKKQEGKTAGASGWIVKPFKPEQLLSVVKMVLP
jgi:two-component system chemotaxis response regulator CheY